MESANFDSTCIQKANPHGLAFSHYSRSTLIQTQKHGVAGAVGRVFVFLLKLNGYNCHQAIRADYLSNTLIRHKDIQTTMNIYVNLNMQAKSNIADTLNAKFDLLVAE